MVTDLTYRTWNHQQDRLKTTRLFTLPPNSWISTKAFRYMKRIDSAAPSTGSAVVFSVTLSTLGKSRLRKIFSKPCDAFPFFHVSNLSFRKEYPNYNCGCKIVFDIFNNVRFIVMFNKIEESIEQFRLIGIIQGFIPFSEQNYNISSMKTTLIFRSPQ